MRDTRPARRWLALAWPSGRAGRRLHRPEPPASDGRITIGLIASLSGAYQAIGEDTRNGFTLYLATHGGRLGGHEVDLVVGGRGRRWRRRARRGHEAGRTGPMSSRRPA